MALRLPASPNRDEFRLRKALDAKGLQCHAATRQQQEPSLMTDKLELFSAKNCPYAHRTRLTLTEKGIDYQLNEINLSDKPKRFLEISFYGKVPAILHGTVEIYESAIINEYLDEVSPQPPLRPSDPGQKAVLRMWVDFMNNHFLGDHYRLIGAQEPEKVVDLIAKQQERFRIMEKALGRFSRGGPFWLGADLTLVDFAYYPFFERLCAWEHYRGLRVPEDCEKLLAWHEVMKAQSSVRACALDGSYYVTHYEGYAKQVIRP
jgi:glutathione S-transferase